MNIYDRLTRVFASAAIALTLALAVGASLWSPSPAREEQAELPQRVVQCYSGGHLFFEAHCEECGVYTPGYVQGITTDGFPFQVSGDCYVLPVELADSLPSQ